MRGKLGDHCTPEIRNERHAGVLGAGSLGAWEQEKERDTEQSGGRREQQREQQRHRPRAATIAAKWPRNLECRKTVWRRGAEARRSLASPSPV